MGVIENELRMAATMPSWKWNNIMQDEFNQEVNESDVFVKDPKNPHRLRTAKRCNKFSRLLLWKLISN